MIIWNFSEERNSILLKPYSVYKEKHWEFKMFQKKAGYTVWQTHPEPAGLDSPDVVKKDVALSIDVF